MNKIGIVNIDDLEDGRVPKKWGSEVVIHNDSDYCGKILRFRKGAKFSMHFHMQKSETWFVYSGVFDLIYIDPEDASEHYVKLKIGDIVERFYDLKRVRNSVCISTCRSPRLGLCIAVFLI